MLLLLLLCLLPPQAAAKGVAAVGEMPVRLLDTKAGTWAAIQCGVAEGEDMPKPRGGHTVSVHGLRLASLVSAASALQHSS